MFGQRSILLVEDDADIRAELSAQFAARGEFVIAEAGSIAQALELLGSGTRRFDAVILDVGLPDGDGREFCASLRAQGLRVPVTMLTGQGSEQDVIRGLDAGANDYVLKPFRFSELLARLRSQMRHFETSEHAEIAIGPFLFRPGVRALQVPGVARPMRLTDKEAAVLKCLYRAGGRPVSRDTLLREVWGYRSDLATHTVETHIYRLRRKIQPVGGERLLINDGQGYRLRLPQPTGAAA